MSRFATIICKYRVVRKTVAFLERNHLTRRTAEDIYYCSRPTFESLNRESVLSCFDRQHRAPVRPKNFVRRFIFDMRRLKRPAVTPITANLTVRNEFRHIREKDILDRLSHMKIAPVNNHGEAAATRNTASNLLSTKRWPVGFHTFSLSGSRAEQEACNSGYRGHHQATDFAQETRKPPILSAVPELLDPGSIAPRWLIISTDTTNHLPLQDKNTLLANGIPIVSYSPTAIPEREANGNRVVTWDGNKLVTKVNGGGNYTENITDSNVDVELIDTPSGDLMLVYVDSFRDPIDITHAYICETPFAQVARYSKEYDMFRETPRVQQLTPYTITTKPGHTFSCLAVRHNDLIQITDNVARVTRYYHRAELMALDGTVANFKAKARLRVDPPTVFGTLQDDLVRFEILSRLGFDKLADICKKCPEFNIPTTTRKDARACAAGLCLTAALASQSEFEAQFARVAPEIRNEVLDILQRMQLSDIQLPASEDVPQPPPGFGRMDIIK